MKTTQNIIQQLEKLQNTYTTRLVYHALIPIVGIFSFSSMLIRDCHEAGPVARIRQAEELITIALSYNIDDESHQVRARRQINEIIHRLKTTNSTALLSLAQNMLQLYGGDITSLTELEMPCRNARRGDTISLS